MISNAQTTIAESVNIDGIYYNLFDNNTCEVGYNRDGRYKGDMVIPETVEYQGVTYSVTAIGYCQAGDLTSVSIPKTVISMHMQAFEVGVRSSYDQTIFETECFLENYYVADDNPVIASVDGVVFNKDKNVLYRCPRGKKGEYKVPESTKLICDYAFFECLNLTTLILPSAFEGFTFSGALDYDPYNQLVGSEFTGCKNLERIELESSDNKSGYVSVDGVLYWKRNGIDYVFADDRHDELDQLVGSSTWNFWELCQYPPGRKDETYKMADAPDGYNVITLGTLNGCQNLREIYFPDMPLVIEQDAARGCFALNTINLPVTLNIDNGAFYECISLKSIDLSKSANKTLYKFTFMHCTSLESIILPKNLEDISELVFNQCDALKEFTLPATVKHISCSAFAQCKNLSKLSVESGNTVYDSRENCNAIIETGTDKLVIGTKSTIIPETITAIGDSAFYCCEMTTLTIPANVKNIGTEALNFSIFNLDLSKRKISLTSLSTVPPIVALQSNPLEGVPTPKITTIHVLPGCKDAYQTADFWKEYTIVEDAKVSDGIKNITNGTQSIMYDLMGRRIYGIGSAPRIVIKNGKKHIQ